MGPWAVGNRHVGAVDLAWGWISHFGGFPGAASQGGRRAWGLEVGVGAEEGGPGPGLYVGKVP